MVLFFLGFHGRERRILADFGDPMGDRPLSPHLSVYRMTRYSLLSSFANRVAGVALSVGLLILVFWLMAVARGPLAYQRASRWLAMPVLKLVYALILVAFAYHLVAGIRHLVWDTGRGLERRQSQRSAWIVLAGTVLLVLLLGYWLAVGHAGAR
jgi:succinate dehydrogenase / fumarate reductase cytochrome b subunit